MGIGQAAHARASDVFSQLGPARGPRCFQVSPRVPPERGEVATAALESNRGRVVADLVIEPGEVIEGPLLSAWRKTGQSGDTIT